jgi:hypothetical protein
MKVCSKCGLEKDFSEFHKFKHSKDGLKSQCKSCVLEKEKERRSTDEYKQKQKEYNQSIPKEVKNEIKRIYYLNNTEKILERNKKWREDNKEYIIEYNKKYSEENKEKISEKSKKYREENKDSIKEWRENNPDKIKVYREKYTKSESCKQHRKNWYRSLKKRSPHVLAWRTILNNTLKRFGKQKEDETIKLLGYSAIELKEYIESLFVEGMSWDNYGEWHIDHIKPVSSYDSDTPVDVVNNLENLQPLWAFDNLSKGNKI